MSRSEANLEYGLFYGDMLYAMPPIKEPIIEHFLYERDCICISSSPGVGKSILALQLLCNLTTGEPFLDTYSIAGPKNVLYIQSEGDRAETLERIRMMAAGVKIDDTRWAHYNMAGTSLNVDEVFDGIRSTIASAGMLFDVIIIDPLYTTVKGSMNSDEVATDWIRNIRKLKEDYECSIIVIHHDGKEIYFEGSVVDKGNNVTFGSTFWQAFYNHNFRLKRVKDVWSLQCGKQRSGKIVEKIEMVLMSPKPLMYTMLADDTDNNTLIVRKFICTALTPVSVKQIIEATTIPQATVYRIVRKLTLASSIAQHHDTVQMLYKAPTPIVRGVPHAAAA